MGYKFCSIDTNVVLRLILIDDVSLYERALNLVTSNKMYFYLPDYAVGEIVHVLEKGYPRDFIVDSIRKVMTLPRLDYYEEFFDKVFEMYLSHPKLSFNDCYLAYKMEDIEREPFYTFDEKLAKQHPAATLVPMVA